MGFATLGALPALQSDSTRLHSWRHSGSSRRRSPHRQPHRRQFAVTSPRMSKPQMRACTAPQQAMQQLVVQLVPTFKLGKPRKRTVHTLISLTKSRCPASIRCRTLSMTCMRRICTARVWSGRASCAKSVAYLALRRALSASDRVCSSRAAGPRSDLANSRWLEKVWCLPFLPAVVS